MHPMHQTALSTVIAAEYGVASNRLRGAPAVRASGPIWAFWLCIPGDRTRRGLQPRHLLRYCHATAQGSSIPASLPPPSPCPCPCSSHPSCLRLSYDNPPGPGIPFTLLLRPVPSRRRVADRTLASTYSCSAFLLDREFFPLIHPPRTTPGRKSTT